MYFLQFGKKNQGKVWDRNVSKSEAPDADDTMKEASQILAYWNAYYKLVA